MDKLVAKARGSFDAKARDIALSKLHERAVEESYFLFWVHDVGPRAVTQGKGLRAGEKLVQDFSTVSMQ